MSTSPPSIGNHPIKVEGDVADSFLNTGQVVIEQLTVNYPEPLPPTVVENGQLKREFHQCCSLLRVHKSTIGRTGKHIARPTVAEIVAWAKTSDEDLTRLPNRSKGRIGVLLDGAGMGKTTVMRDALLELEGDGFCVLAIKSDQQLAGVSDAANLRQNLNIAVGLQEAVTALAQEGPVAILIDQIDALSLSLSRDQRAMDAILAMVANLIEIKGVRVLLSCRTFDLKSDPRLRGFEECRTFALTLLEECRARSFLEARGLSWSLLSKSTQELLRQPLALDLFVTALESKSKDTGVLDRGYAVTTLQDLYRLLWDSVIRRDEIGSPPIAERESVVKIIAQKMVEHSRTSVPKSLFSSQENSYLEPSVRWLASAGILVEAGAEWALIHQTFIDYCAAKYFVESGAALSDSILDGDQGLLARARLLQTIVYLRGSEPDAYLIQLHRLLNAQNLREHLRVLLFGWFGAIQDPSDGEWNLAMRLLDVEPQRALLLDWMGNNLGWFQRLKSNFLPAWLEVEGDFLDQHVLPFLLSFTESAQGEVAELLSPYVGKNRQWNARVMSWTATVQDWRAPEGVRIFEQAIAATIAESLERGDKIVFGYMMGLKKLIEFDPIASCRILRSMLDGLLAVYRSHREESKYPESDNEHLKNSRFSLPERLEAFNGSSARDLLEELPSRAPETFLKQIVPWLEDAVGNVEFEERDPRYNEYHYARDEFYDYWYMGGAGIRRLLAAAIAQSLASVALESPELFATYVNRLEVQQSISAHQILVQAFQISPVLLANEAAVYLMGDKRRFDIGDHRRDDSRQLVASIAPHLSFGNLEKLQRTIIQASRDWKRFVGKERHLLDCLGRDELFLLEAIPPEYLLNESQIVIQELRRKFPDSKAPDSSHGFQTIRDRTALPLVKALRISDDAWLRIFQRFLEWKTPVGDLERRDHHRRISSLSGALIDSIVAQPERFWRLFNHLKISGLCQSLSINHRNAFIQGFGSATTSLKKRYGISKVPPPASAAPEAEWQDPQVAPAGWFFEVLRGLAPEPGIQGYGPSFSASWQDTRQSIGRHLKNHVEDLPVDLIEMLESYVRCPPFGDIQSHDSFEKERERLETNSAHDSRNAVINHERGVCFETLMRVYDKQKSTDNEKKRWEVLDYVATDPSPVLRVAAIEELRYRLQHDRDRATSLFEMLCNDFPELIRAADTREFLYWAIRGQFLRLCPYIKTMLDKTLPDDTETLGANSSMLSSSTPTEAGLAKEVVLGEDSMRDWVAKKKRAQHRAGAIHDAECAQNGAELVSLAALSIEKEDKKTAEEIERLLQTCLNGSAPWRRGVAHIAAHNLKSSKVGICVAWLHHLISDCDKQVQQEFGQFFRLASKGVLGISTDTVYAFAQDFASSPALLNNLDSWKDYLWFVSRSNPEKALALVELMLQNPHRSRERFYSTQDWMRLALRVYTDPLCDSSWRERGLSVFDRLMGENSGVAHQLLLEWDRR